MSRVLQWLGLGGDVDVRAGQGDAGAAARDRGAESPVMSAEIGIGEIRERLAGLTADSEEARHDRRDLANKIDRLSESVAAATLANATVTATLGATLAAHVRQCEVDKRAVADNIAQSNAERREMHEATHKGIEGLRRLVFIGVGGVLALGFSVGVAIHFLHH